jgi:leader peptidase (prepilin peptidase)/N-methyltransferase
VPLKNGCYLLSILLAKKNRPSSHCPKCKHKIRFWCKIPIISFLILKGRCLHCKEPISIRYPLIEILSCIASILIAYRWGVTWQTVFLLPLTWALIVLTFIDIDYYILPDIITIPCLWLGLISSLFPLFASSKEAILGAIFGYIFLWVTARIFKLICGIEGMGHGDFKLLAVFGAWCGWQALLPIILLAALLGVIIGGLTLWRKKYSFQHPIPFGPFIAISGWMALMWNAQVIKLF